MDCLGTGSTSWCYNINKMSVQSMKKIMQLGNCTAYISTWFLFSHLILFLFKAKNELSKSTNKQVLNQLDIDTDEFVQRITNNFNDSIVFKPDQLRMAYTIRDPIINRKRIIFYNINLTCFLNVLIALQGIFLNETNRGFAEKYYYYLFTCKIKKLNK